MASKPPVAGSALSEAVKDPELRVQLEATRDEIVRAIPDAPPAPKAALIRQLVIVLEKLDALPKANKVTVADDLARKRKDRRAAAQARASAAGAGTGG